MSTKYPQRAESPATLLLEVRGYIQRSQAGSKYIGQIDTAPGWMECNGGSKVFSNRILRQSPDLIKGGCSQHHIGSTDKGRIESRLSWTQQVIKHGLLVVRPMRYRVVQVGIILTGLHPTHLWITKRHDGFEQEVQFGDLISVKDDDEGVTRRIQLLTCMFNVASLCSTLHGAGHTTYSQLLRQMLGLFPVSGFCYTTIVTYNNSHLPMWILCQVLITSCDDAFQCWPENCDPLVNSGDKNENGMLGRIFALLNFWWRPGPYGKLKTKYMQ